MEITEQQIQQMIQTALDNRAKANQYGVSLIPYHIHNGTDSPLIDNKTIGGFELLTNKKTSITSSDTDYPTCKAVETGLAGKQNTIAYTPEDVSNKATSFGTSNDTLYPSVKAVSDYVTTKVPNFSASADFLYKVPADGVGINKTGNTPTKFIDVTCPVSGTLRIKWQAGTTYDVTGYTRVYRNGSAVGVQKTMPGGGSAGEFTDDVSGWSAGDKIEIYCWTSSVSGTAQMFQYSGTFAEGRLVAVYGVQLVWSSTSY